MQNSMGLMDVKTKIHFDTLLGGEYSFILSVIIFVMIPITGMKFWFSLEWCIRFSECAGCVG